MQKKGHLFFAEKIFWGLRYAYVDIMRDIGGWFLIGVLIAGVISLAVPDRFFESLPGHNMMAMSMIPGLLGKKDPDHLPQRSVSALS